jgi:hypothetical protein
MGLAREDEEAEKVIIGVDISRLENPTGVLEHGLCARPDK